MAVKAPTVLPLLALLGLILLSGCVGEGEEGVEVVASIYPLYLVAKEVSNATYLVPPNANPHLWEPTPSAVERARSAPIYVRVGFEGWDRAFMEGKKVFTAMDFAEPIDRNPHVWLSPQAMAALGEALAEELGREERGRAFRACVEDTAQRIRQEVGELGPVRYVAYTNAFSYYARDLGLEEVAVVSEQGIVTPQRYERVKALMEREGIGIIITTPQFRGDVVERLAKETNATVVVLDPLGVNASSYCQLLWDNWLRIKAALGGGTSAES